VSSPNDSQTPETELCRALYEMIESAAIVMTCNRDVLLAFKDARTKAGQDLALRGMSAGLSLWAGYSAFWTTTAVSMEIAPLAAWGLSDVIGLALFAEVPVLVTTTTTLWWCAPVAIPAAIGAAVFGYSAWKKKKERNKYNDKINYHEACKLHAHLTRHTSSYCLRNAVKVYLGSAFGLAQDTQKFLQWVHNTNAANPTEVDFVDDEARQNWRTFVTTTSAGNTQPLAERLSPQFVRTYLMLQRGTLDRFRDSMVKIEKKYLS
jgi:hypothetical protein